MSTSKILQRNAKLLREKALEIPVKEIKSKKIQSLIAKMSKILASQKDGVALAAPQIDVSLRLFVISGRILSLKKKTREVLPDIVFINPNIIKLSKKKQVMEEGCLSVRWLYGKVKRSEKATIRAYDQHGRLFTKGASGLLAQAFQHEVDHLDGILFTDKATHLENFPPENHA